MKQVGILSAAFWLFVLGAVRAETFVSLSAPDGGTVLINPHEITSIREPTASGHFPRGVRCVVVMTNKNLFAVTNTCDEVRRLAESVSP